MVQKKQALPTAPVAPRSRCRPKRLVRSGCSGLRRNIGITSKKPISERKNRISMLGSRVPRNFTTVAMITSVMEPADTSTAPRATGSMACQRASTGA